jgi:hypothetical protein
VGFLAGISDMRFTELVRVGNTLGNTAGTLVTWIPSRRSQLTVICR